MCCESCYNLKERIFGSICKRVDTRAIRPRGFVVTSRPCELAYQSARTMYVWRAVRRRQSDAR